MYGRVAFSGHKGQKGAAASHLDQDLSSLAATSKVNIES
jgi:hypothetical protein